MRRRRTAAPDSETVETSETPDASDAAVTESPAEISPASPSETVPQAEDPAAAPKRRRAPRKKAAPADEATETVPEAPAPPAEVPAEPPRRGRRRGKTTLTPSAEEGVIVLDEPALEAAADTPPPTDEAAAPGGPAPDVIAEETPPDEGAARPRRSRGGRGRTRTAVVAESETATAEPVETPPAPAEDAPQEEAAAAAPARRSRRRGKATAEAPAPEMTTPTPVDVIAPHAEPPAEQQAPDDEAPARTRRTRGLRRTATAAEPAEPAPPAYQALPAETLARLPETRVAPRKGVPELLINGEPQLPFWFFVNTEDPEAQEIAAREIRQAYQAGVRFFTLLAHLPWTGRDGARRYGPLDEALDFVARHAPEGFLLPRLIFSPPASWERAHPGEMSRYGNGEDGDVSLASRAFWDDEADRALRAAVEHVAEGPHAGRVFGFYLEHGEWFYPAGQGYDVSEPNRDAFRVWLRTHYRNDVVALRAAWHDGKVTFETAEIPAPLPPTTAIPGSLNLLYGPRERRHADFHEFSSDLVARVITRLGRAVKEASGNRSAVAVSYGYSLELPRAGSGHLSLATLLDSPFVDILTGPYSYAGRTPGGSASLPTPTGSVVLAGKLWVSEDDTKTFRARRETPDGYNPRIPSAEETQAVHARNFGAALTHGAGLSWMDLWGEGWLDDPATWEHLGRLRDLAGGLATRRRNPRTKAAPAPDVAVIVDERSFFGVRADEMLLGRLIGGQRDVLLRSGARIGFYLMSDLARKNFPDTPRLLLFLNAFRFPTEVRTAIRERFQDDGRTLAWLYGPGCQETAGDATSISELTDVLGIHLRLQAWGSKTGTQVTDGRSPLTEHVRGQRLGEESRVNPSFYVSDTRAQILGEYLGSGNASVAVRKHPRWQSVFIGEAALTPALLRGLYRLAGVPSFTTEDDVAWVGDSLICLHSAEGGAITVALPEEAHLYDLLNRETLAVGGRGQRLAMPARGTRLLFFGTGAEVARLGGDPNDGPPGLSEAELPLPPQPFAFEAADAAPADVSPEDEEMMAAVLSGDVPIVNKDAGEAAPDDDENDEDADAPAAEAGAPAAGGEAEAAEPGKKKRRRRRGRRGRGGETEGETEALEAGALPPPVGDGDENGNGAAAPPRSLPPLSELLPESEMADDGSLPPIPEELLPLDRDTDADEGDADVEGVETAAGEPIASRRRRGRSRRRRRPEGDASPADAPAGETP